VNQDDLAPAAFGLFDTVIGGPAAVPFAVGWALLFAGYLWSLLNNQLNAIRGQPKPHTELLVNTALHAALLGTYALISKWVWMGAQSLAHSIYPDTKLQMLTGALKEVSLRFQQYTFTFSITNVAQGLKDSAVSFTAFMSMVLALVSHYQIKQVQAGVYNVVFIFGPLLIGAGAFGIPTARIWIFALVEVSSWSIAAAALYHGLTSTFQRYLSQAASAMPGSATETLLDTSFLEAINGLIFLSTAMIVVPIITGRLLGSSTLGELAHVQVAGASLAARVGGFVASMQTDTAPRADSSAHGGPPPRPTRPGD